jgi:hypothetical protein
LKIKEILYNLNKLVKNEKKNDNITKKKKKVFHLKKKKKNIFPFFISFDFFINNNQKIRGKNIIIE